MKEHNRNLELETLSILGRCEVVLHLLNIERMHAARRLGIDSKRVDVHDSRVGNELYVRVAGQPE